MDDHMPWWRAIAGGLHTRGVYAIAVHPFPRLISPTHIRPRDKLSVQNMREEQFGNLALLDDKTRRFIFQSFVFYWFVEFCLGFLK
jgi:hypothetical protein